MNKKESPTPAGLSSRGITWRGLWGGASLSQKFEKKHIWYVGIMTRWARELEGGLSTPRSWPLGVQFEGGERGALVDKVKKKRIRYPNLELNICENCMRGKVLDLRRKTFHCIVLEWNLA